MYYRRFHFNPWLELVSYWRSHPISHSRNSASPFESQDCTRVSTAYCTTGIRCVTREEILPKIEPEHPHSGSQHFSQRPSCWTKSWSSSPLTGTAWKPTDWYTDGKNDCRNLGVVLRVRPNAMDYTSVRCAWPSWNRPEGIMRRRRLPCHRTAEKRSRRRSRGHATPKLSLESAQRSFSERQSDPHQFRLGWEGGRGASSWGE